MEKEKTFKKQLHKKVQIWMHYEQDSLTSMDKISLDELICC